MAVSFCGETENKRGERERLHTFDGAGEESLRVDGWEDVKPPPEKAVVTSNWDPENIFETLEREKERELEVLVMRSGCRFLC